MTYQEAQSKVAAAERASLAGDSKRAAGLFAQAAAAQLEFVRSLPEDRVKTRSVYGVSSAILLYKAGSLDDAERTLHGLLGERWLLPESAQRARDMLALIWGDRILHQRQSDLSRAPLSIIFRGGAVANGIAPADAVDLATRQVRSIVNRCGDYMNDLPIDSKQDNVQRRNMYEAWAAQPAFGSYRVDLFIAKVGQIDLPGMRNANSADPQAIVRTVVRFLDGMCAGNLDSVSECVRDEGYRLMLARLARNLVPDGYDVGEVELGLRQEGEAPCTAVVNASRREYVNYVVKALAERSRQPAGTSREERDTDDLIGTLRAVDLDEKNIRLDEHGTLKIAAEIALDDVIGPMLNKRVHVVRRKRRRAWVVEDVELAV